MALLGSGSGMAINVKRDLALACVAQGRNTTALLGCVLGLAIAGRGACVAAQLLAAPAKQLEAVEEQKGALREPMSSRMWPRPRRHWGRWRRWRRCRARAES